MRVQKIAEHRAMPWANGRGTSYEIASDRDDAGDWSWRVAFAPVNEDGPFSMMPGVDRELVVIEGAGMDLDVDGTVLKCLPGRVVGFSGDSTTIARLVDGPVVDLGLMVRRGRGLRNMVFIDTPQEMPNSAVIVALSSHVEIRVGQTGEQVTLKLDRLDALILDESEVISLISGSVACIVVP